MAEDRFYACICEGVAEREIINMLLDENKLIFSRDQLLDKEVLRCRRARDFEDKYLGKGFNKKITVYRILDSRRERFNLRAAYRDKVEVVNVITAPEIEMLIIIGLGKYSDYSKCKSTTKPSEFCKNKLGKKRVKDAEFVNEFFRDIDFLVNTIKEYKRISNIPSNEKCLADILK